MKSNSFLVGAVLGIALLFAVSFALAAKDNENAAKPTATNDTQKNMTFGQCVSDAADVKNTCYEAAKTQRDACMDEARNQTSKDAAKTCSSDYKKAKSDCKKEFKADKNECGKIKHSWVDSMKARFK